MTARERVIIRAVARALREGDTEKMDAYSSSYGLSIHNNHPIKDRAAALLNALVTNDRS
jgi:hypothetical protein